MAEKHIYRVEATDGDGSVVYRRDYQGWDAARLLADVLLSRYPTAQVTIRRSHAVTWPDPPVLWHVGERRATDA